MKQKRCAELHIPHYSPQTTGVWSLIELASLYTFESDGRFQFELNLETWQVRSISCSAVMPLAGWWRLALGQ